MLEAMKYKHHGMHVWVIESTVSAGHVHGLFLEALKTVI